MNKSLEALENLVHCKSETKCKECKHKYRCTMERDYQTIKQDLERLEELKQVWNTEEWCQGIPLSADSLKSLFNYNEELFNKNLALDKKKLELEKENLLLRQSVKDTYDTSQEIIADLKEEIQDLKDNETIVADYGVNLWNENQKLKRALDKACERLDWECPVSQDLIADLDCENRCSDDFEECCKECWKIYFLKEVAEK